MMVRMAGQGDVASAAGSAPPIAGAAAIEEPAGDLLQLVGDPTAAEVRLPNRPESAAIARQLAQSAMRLRWAAPPGRTEQTVLLVSELVGNAVRHTGAHVFGLRMLRRGSAVRVEVQDPSRGLPCRLPVRELDTSGWGLYLVDTLADRWGVDLQPYGKTTWFELRLQDR
ncbi:ATP-binding protein [Streptomyces sulphureus]|uniref:ATP-binding protein n=1 Tax=Streptomyces sulphureus TaxID=47758 RepID=UPI00035E51C6|nr:ATP-binding protein [Streptomyces sulphureus]